jgi:hypothetical protein
MAEQNTKKESTFAEKFGKKKTFTSTQVDKNNNTDNANNDETKIESKSEIIAEEQKSKKAVDPQKRALAQYIYLVRGVDAGRNAWYYVLVERLKVQLFLKALNDEIIHLEKYGKILYSAYGDEPPANVTQAIKDEYGIS